MEISKEQAVNWVCEAVKSVQRNSQATRHDAISAQTTLLGSSAVLNSMQLVELCLALEDKAVELGFEFDWTSDAAMSQARSMFRSVDSLAAEFRRQSQASSQ